MFAMGCSSSRHLGFSSVAPGILSGGVWCFLFPVMNILYDVTRTSFSPIQKPLVRVTSCRGSSSASHLTGGTQPIMNLPALIHTYHSRSLSFWLRTWGG